MNKKNHANKLKLYFFLYVGWYLIATKNYIIVGMKNGTAISEDGLAVSYKAKSSFSTSSSNCNPRKLSKGEDSLCSH